MTRVAAPLGPEHDTVPPRPPGAPLRPYIVCATPRSGSSMLVRALTETGVAAVPTEYFHPLKRPVLEQRWGCEPTLESYVAALIAHRTSHDGIFGTKLHWHELELLRAESDGIPAREPGFDVPAAVVEDLFPAPLYIHIVRRDVDRQAVSLWRASKSGVWSAYANGDGPPVVPYRFAGIARCRSLITDSEVHWDRFFRFNGIEPVEVVYEDLVRDYAGTVGALVERIAPGAGAVSPPPPVSRGLADELSDELYARFLGDPRRAPTVKRVGRLMFPRNLRRSGQALLRR